MKKHLSTPDSLNPAEKRVTMPYSVAYAATLVLCVVVVLAFAGFIPLGQWADEFDTVRLYQNEGYSFFVQRILHWSPRPLSELLIYWYSMAVKSANRPLIGVSLSLTWLAFGLALLAVPVLTWNRLGARRWSLAVLVALALFCLLLLGHPVGEMYYWPMAAIAYMPVAAALSLTLWMLVLTDMSSVRSRIICAASLVVAATSAEVGAMLVFVFCAAAMLCTLLNLKQGQGVHILKRNAWIVIPFATSLGVLVLLYVGRVASAAEVFGDKAIAHHFIPALRSTIHRFAQEALSSDGNGLTPRSILIGSATKILFLLAVYGIIRFLLSAKGSTRNSLLLAILAFACFLTSFMTLGAAFYQFGVACCERHDTMRQCFIFIGLASTGAAGAAYTRGRADAGALGTHYVVFLLLAVLIPTVIATPDIVSNYRDYRHIQDAKIANWNAGMAPGNSMVYVQRPLGKIVGGFSVPDGTYTLTSESAPALAKWIIHFFKKDKVTFVTEQ